MIINHGDALSVLRSIPSESVNCCVTSPPYYGLRDYGVEGQIGLEATPDEYIARLVAVFREVRRVLADDGVVFVNIGDSYARTPAKGGSGPNGKHDSIPSYSDAQRILRESNGSSDGKVGRGDRAATRVRAIGIKEKDLIGIPWMLAFALRADGWYLRQDIIWSKPNPMPESVKDRCTKAHEYIFLLTKSARYWWDAEAIAEPAIYAGKVVTLGEKSLSKGQANGANVAASGNGNADSVIVAANRNRRSVWTLATLPTPEAHFATYPIELPELCIRAGCPEGGVVLDPFCGAGTTALAALKNGREFIGIELNPAYIEIARQRAEKYYPLLASV